MAASPRTPTRLRAILRRRFRQLRQYLPWWKRDGPGFGSTPRPAQAYGVLGRATHRVALPWWARPAGPPALVLALSLAALTCARSKWHVDYNTDAGFGQATFGWLAPRPDLPALTGQEENRLANAVEKRLKARGLTLSERSPELLVTWHAGQNEAIDLEPYGYAYWPSQWARGGYRGGAEDYVFGKNEIVIDLVDGASQALLWRGSARGLFRGSAERRAEKMNVALDSLFAQFPPPWLAREP